MKHREQGLLPFPDVNRPLYHVHGEHVGSSNEARVRRPPEWRPRGSLFSMPTQHPPLGVRRLSEELGFLSP